MARKIHIIFKTHLDVGFTDYAASIRKRYFDHFIPDALALARRRREADDPNRFIWTTGSWLIFEYLESADAGARAEMEAAILAGDIAWHALPFTTHSELMDADLFRTGLSLSRRLDERFGRRTIAAKFTDVPGHTRGILPLMAEFGIEFLQIGVNPGSTVPSVPPLFRWRDPSGAEIVTLYESGYGNAFPTPDGKEALYFGHSSDNLGPPDDRGVDEIYAAVRGRFPGAEAAASTLDRFAAAILPFRETLPVVTAEIGDSWIHGVGSDPLKVAQFRELLRLRKTWRTDGETEFTEKIDRFERGLLMIPEHTWGMDEKTFLADYDHYDAESFRAARTSEKFRKFEASWAEQRAYIPAAVSFLRGTPYHNEAERALTALAPKKIDPRDWVPFDAAREKDLSGATVRLDPDSGAISAYSLKGNGAVLADSGNKIGEIAYQTFSAADYERFLNQYILPSERVKSWSGDDFAKPGMGKTGAASRFWFPRAVFAWERGREILFLLEGDPEAVRTYGCPREFTLRWTFSASGTEIDAELQWFGKQACRLPEATWFGINPAGTGDGAWTFDKLGGRINPLDVIENGNRRLHAVETGAEYRDAQKRIEIETLDAPLVAPGEPSLLNFTNETPDLSKGVRFNLHNNIWGTNFPMWVEDDCRFRFRIRFEAAKESL